MYRLGVSECTVRKEFKWNDKFTVEQGMEFFTSDGFLSFPECTARRPDGGYRTVFGPVFYHTGCVYGKSDNNSSCALTRQTAQRTSPGDLVDDHQLNVNQRDAVANSWTLKEVVNVVRARIERKFLEVDVGRLNDVYVEQEHSKRPERLLAREELKQRGWWQRAWACLDTDSVEGLVKPGEWAKFMKYPRLFVSLGKYSIMAAGAVMDRIKGCFGLITIAGCQCEFIKSPDKDSMSSVFDKLIFGKQAFYMAYFSDDSCIAINTSDGRRYTCNFDISSCDCSHTRWIFHLLELLVQDVHWLVEMIDWAVQQCKAPLVVRSRSGKRDHKVKLQPVDPVLYSGSVLTTVVNNCAQLLMYSVMVDRIRTTGPPKFAECRS